MSQSSEEHWYDLEYDRVLIEQSIAKQYGILPSEQEHLHYCDWAKMVSGLMEDTPLGRVVSIRCEKDREIIKNMSPSQLALRREWEEFRVRKMVQSPAQMQAYKQQLQALEQAFAVMFQSK